MTEEERYNAILIGEIPGHRIFGALGERQLIGTTASGEDMTRMNQLSPAPTSHLEVPTPADAGELMTVVSESADDTLLGSGIQVLRIHYLSPEGFERIHDVEMNGLTPVDIPVILMRFIQDMHAAQVGSGNVAADHIKIYKTGTVGLVYNMIEEGGNRSLVPHRMVPFGRQLILKGFHATEGNNKRAAFRIRSTDDDGVLIPGVFLFIDTVYLNGTSSGEVRLNHISPSLSIIKVTAWGTTNLPEGSCHWWGELIGSSPLGE
jgi:hypothetical protein